MAAKRMWQVEVISWEKLAYLCSRETSHFTKAIRTENYVTWVWLIIRDNEASIWNKRNRIKQLKEKQVQRKNFTSADNIKPDIIKFVRVFRFSTTTRRETS